MKFYVTLFFIFGYFYVSGQASDCIDAIVVCGNNTISSNASGFGIQELDAETNVCVTQELNSLWLSVNIAESGTLAFTIQPQDNDLEVDYDFFIFGPDSDCQILESPIRCSTTNPLQAGLTSNFTGLSDVETDQNEGPGELGNAYVSSIPVTAGEHYYILIDRPIGNGGFNLDWTGTAQFLPSPIVSSPQDIEVCYNGGNTIIDLMQNEATITTTPNVNISYYTSYNNAFDNIDAITNPASYSYSGLRNRIYVKVTNPNGCFEIVDFSIISPSFDTPPELSYSTCDTDNDARAEFSILEITSDAESAIQHNLEFNLSLHLSENEAMAGTNAITNPLLTTESTTIYARVISTLNTNCFITYPITLTVNPSEFPAILDLIQCDIDENSSDGFTSINLNQSFPEVDHSTISYYESEANRTSNNAIESPANYTNTLPFNQTIYYKITTVQCENFGEIAIEINPTIINLNSISPVQICDDDLEDSVLESTFDLENIRNNNYAGLDVAFYSNLVDATLEQNPLNGNLRTSATTLYVRLETNNQCQGVEEIELIVNPIPEVILEENYLVCANGEPLRINAPAGYDKYSWFKDADNQFIEIGNDQQIAVSVQGNYILEVEKHYDNNGEVIICTGYTDFTVTTSAAVVIENVDIQKSFNTNTVTVNVIGTDEYEYSIDSENYQDENTFYNVEAGIYTIYARNKNGCGFAEKQISIIGFPKFFTPNGDGNNDTWQLIGVNENTNDQIILIYDRYGKMVYQINSNSVGWDGSINGNDLPESDYWFKMTLNDGNDFKGHFTLKR
ncbi:T9SS type B sorting domain-containing protein [Maribacter forsetii]|uniref:T9SS type B sorting domain-containing protein n=1 Tax=Maribacter forsetii TaxID=444515 RepID=UPI00068974CD|nr:T9SS type B sorting domain-containing protein [Maribacter forsetii]